MTDESSGPFAGWSKLNEGWEGGELDAQELVENAKLVARNSIGPVLYAWLAISSPLILTALLSGTAFTAGFYAGSEAMLTIGNILAVLMIPVTLVIGIAKFALFRPMQMQAFEGREFVSGIGETFRLSKEVLVKVILTTLLFGVSLALGTIACGIGSLVAVFFFVQAPYLAATTAMSPMDCMRRSYELSKSYAIPTVIALAGALTSIGIGGCLGAFFRGIGGLLANLSPPIGNMVGEVLASVGTVATEFVALVILAIVFTSIQSLERKVGFKRD